MGSIDRQYSFIVGVIRFSLAYSVQGSKGDGAIMVVGTGGCEVVERAWYSARIRDIVLHDSHIAG